MSYGPWTRGALTARLASTRRRFDRALERTAEFLAAHPRSYVAWSGGKDSTVVAHLAHTVDPSITIGHYESSWCLPETHDHMRELADRFGWRRRDYQVGSALDAMRRNGSWDFHAPDGPDDWGEVIIYGPARLAYQDHPDGMLWGLRADESIARRWRLAPRRGVFQRRHGDCAGQWVAAPIWDWSTETVWAYHAHHDIPPSPVYQRLADLGVPEVAHRVSLILSSDGIDRGRAAWLRRGWPDLFNEVSLALPRAREES